MIVNFKTILKGEKKSKKIPIILLFFNQLKD
jgi:hypothetical protein